MPIYDLGYRHWSGGWTSHPYRWWVITRQGILLLTQKKRFLVLMFLSLIPFLVRSIILYFATVVGNMPILKIDAKFFEDFLTQQMFFAFIIAIYAGAGLVANDLKANALQIYLAKPITRQDYLIGKLGVLFFFLSLPTLVPGILLYLLAALFRSDLSFLRENAWVLPAILAYSLLIVASYSLIMMTFSSMTQSSRFAGIGFAAIFFFSQILFGILSSILRTTRVAWVSLGNNLSQVGDFLFDRTPQYRSEVWISAVVLVALMAGCAVLIYRKIRAVEVVR